MIPSDLAARLRTLTEASFFNTEPPLPGLQRARAIQSQLPDLVPGQRFFATLQRTLPDGTFTAVVAGRQMTLALNTSAQAGDTLELEVTQNTPRAVFARVLNVEAGQQAATNASAQPALSSAGRMISFLLTGQPASPPVSLAGNRPLLATPPSEPAQVAQLGPALRQAVSQSGLFYESHQVQWVLGKLETAALLREPQGQASALLAQAGAAQTTQAGENPAGKAPTNLLTQLLGLSSGAATSGTSPQAGPTAANTLPSTPTATAAGTPPPGSSGGALPAGTVTNLVTSLLGLSSAANPQAAAGMAADNLPAGTGAAGDVRPAPGAPAPGAPGASAGAAQGVPGQTGANPAASAQRGAGTLPPADAKAGFEAELPPPRADEQSPPSRAGAFPMPDRLMPVVHQQLDALATQQYVWQGQAWPGQPLEWIIEDPEHEGAEGEATEATWNTTLRLTLPRLGGVEASLHLTPAGVALRLRADEEAALHTLDAGAPALASALEAANLKLTGLVVERRSPSPPNTPTAPATPTAT